jgi:hypothetical protein
MTRGRIAGALLGALVLAGLVASCRDYLPQNRFLRPRTQQASQSTADARNKFDHAKHAATLQEKGMTCLDCHRFDARIETARPELAKALSGAGLVPGGSACHYCHGPSQTQIAAAPSACTTCHANLVPLLPANHQIAWARVHASVASADPVACQNCHRDAFCVNCHQNRDSILTFVHQENYLSYHGIDARANPIQCGNCHREDFCLKCHAQAVR